MAESFVRERFLP